MSTHLLYHGFVEHILSTSETQRGGDSQSVIFFLGGVNIRERDINTGTQGMFRCCERLLHVESSSMKNAGREFDTAPFPSHHSFTN